MYGYNQNNGIIYQNQELLDEIDNRIMERNIPTTTLQSVFDPRPANTRRVIFPALDCHKPSNTPIINKQPYNNRNTFNPGSKSPFSGYATFIDQETKLKNLFSPIQKEAAQNTFIPSSNSDLYNFNHLPQINYQQTNINQPHTLLFQDYNQFKPFNPNSKNIGLDSFNNHTRQQRRAIPVSTVSCDQVNNRNIRCSYNNNS